MKKIRIITSDLYLDRLLHQLLRLKGYTPLSSEHDAHEKEDERLRIVDIDTCSETLLGPHDIVLSRKDTALLPHTVTKRLTVPFLHDALFALLQEAELPSSKKDAPLRLLERGAALRGKEIPLTETERCLLKALIDADGAFVRREELVSNVGSGERGLNVFIHYLRKKLEADGEHVLLCSRAKGYCIDRRFLHP